MRNFAIMLCILSLTSALFAAEPDNNFVSKDFGFSIQPPIDKTVKSPNYVIAMFFLPSSDNFSANVNVIQQAYDADLKNYDEQTMNQCKQANFKMIKRTLKENEIVYEYSGVMNGQKMHFYCRAVKQDKFIYLITATGLEKNWDKQKDELMKSVDSFTLKK